MNGDAEKAVHMAAEARKANATIQRVRAITNAFRGVLDAAPVVLDEYRTGYADALRDVTDDILAALDGAA